MAIYCNVTFGTFHRTRVYNYPAHTHSEREKETRDRKRDGS